MRSLLDKAVLIVDEDPSGRSRLRQALQAFGLAVVDAVDEADAIRKCRQLRFDLILMSMGSPHDDRMGPVIAIRLVDPQCRIIVVGAGDQDRAQETLRQLGIRRFVRSPMHLDELREAVLAELSGVGDVADNSALCIPEMWGTDVERPRRRRSKR